MPQNYMKKEEKTTTKMSKNFRLKLPKSKYDEPLGILITKGQYKKIKKLVKSSILTK